MPLTVTSAVAVFPSTLAVIFALPFPTGTAWPSLIFTMLSLVFLSIANTGHGHDPEHPENTNETQEEEYAEAQHAVARQAHH